MAWWSTLFGRRAKAVNPGDDRYYGYQQLSTTLDLPSWVRDGFSWEQYDELLMRYLGWVYVCASRNADAVASQPIRLYRFGKADGRKLSKQQRDYLRTRPDVRKYMRDIEEAVEITNHPALALLNKPNPDDDPASFTQTTQLHQELTGNAYWAAVKAADADAPFELRILAPNKMEFIKSEDGSSLVGRWDYHNGAAPKRLAPETVCHFRMSNPRHPVYGFGPLQGALLSQDQDMMMRSAEIHTYENRSTPELILSLLGNTGQTEIERMRKEWEAIHRGPKNAGKTALMSNIDVKRMGLTPKELAMPEQTQWMRECIAAAFGQPMSMLTLDSANRAASEAGLYQYAKWTVLPRLVRRDEKLTSWLLPKFGDATGLFFCSDDPTPPHYEWLLKTRTLNEIRAMEGLDPLEDGDAAPGVSMGGFGLGGVSGQGDQDSGTAVTTERRVARARVKQANAPDNSQSIDLEAVCRDVLRQQRSEVINNIIARPVRGKADSDPWLFDRKEWDRRLAAVAAPIEESIFLEAGREAAAKFGLGTAIAFDVTNEAAIRAVKRTAAKFASSFNATTQRSLTELFRAAVSEGWTPQETIKNVEELMQYAERYRAERVARTEQRRAVSAGHEELFSQSGVTQKQWDASGDACEFCVAMHGRIIEVGVPFIALGASLEGADGGTLAADYLDIDGPPLHPNCRCVMVPVVESIR